MKTTNVSKTKPNETKAWFVHVAVYAISQETERADMLVGSYTISESISNCDTEICTDKMHKI